MNNNNHNPDEPTESLASQHRRWARAFARDAQRKLYSPFADRLLNVQQALRQLEEAGDAREDVIAALDQLFEQTQLEAFDEPVNSVAAMIASRIIGEYEAQLDELFRRQPFESAIRKYALSADLRASQVARIRALIASNFSFLIGEAKELANQRGWLYVHFPEYRKFVGVEYDVGALARNVGLGALAVANPLLGVPALIANWKLQSDKNEKSQALIDNWIEKLNEFVQRLEGLEGHVAQACEKSAQYIEQKFRETCGDAIAHILAELQGAGHSAAHYYDALDHRLAALPST